MNQKVIDTNSLKKLSTIIGGDVEDLQELVDDFITALPQQIKCMRDAQAANDLAALSIVVHSTKSNARDMGALELADICAKLEQQCKNENPTDLNAQLTDISTRADQALLALKLVNLNDV